MIDPQRRAPFGLLLGLLAFAAAPAAADYLEECQREGCSSEEVEELYESYEEECLHEGCSFEEVIELAGSPSSVSAMLSDFRKRGWRVDDKDFGAGQCVPVSTNTKCAFVILLCQDVYQSCPGGLPTGEPTKSAWYVCGSCFGFDF